MLTVNGMREKKIALCNREAWRKHNYNCVCNSNAPGTMVH